MANYFDKIFMDRCSEKTLQSNDKGFFMSFVEHVAEHTGDQWIKKRFGSAKTDKERIRLIYTDDRSKDAVCEVLKNVQEMYRPKNETVAEQTRLEAEKESNKENWKKSVLLYSQSVLRATCGPIDGKDGSNRCLPLALWGRAKAFMAQSEYSLALEDIRQALKVRIPESHKAEAFWKMSVCYKALQENEKAAVAFSLAEKTLSDAKKIDSLKEDHRKEFQQAEKLNRKILPKIFDKSRNQYVNSSKKLEVKQNETMGRHVVATEPISTGELLVVEPPYATCLLPDCFGTHCHHCFERLLAPVGCTTCANVAFCKPECQTAALTSYHKYECKFLNLLIGSGMSILSHTALRMITQNSLGRCLDLYANREKEKVYTLCTNESKRNASDFLQRTLMAAFLLRCLQKSGFFTNRKSDEDITPTEEEFKIGELILLHLQILQFNAHEIYETRYGKDHRFRGAKAAYIAVGVYPTAALFNHNCYPAVTRYFVGKNIVFNASRRITPGELVAENYGPHFLRKPLEERQKTLAARYWFSCQCTACKENWPTIDNGLESVSRRLRCPTANCDYLFTIPTTRETLKCPKCEHEVVLTKSLERMKRCEKSYNEGIEAMEAEDPRKAIRVICAAIDDFHRISSPPHKETHLAQEVLRACLADSGNAYECLTSPTVK